MVTVIYRVGIVLLFFRAQRLESFVGGQFCLQASVAFTNTAITNAVEKLRNALG